MVRFDEALESGSPPPADKEGGAGGDGAQTEPSVAKVLSMSDDLDAKWKAFQAKFDTLHRTLVLSIAGSLGVEQRNRAPIPISEARVAQTPRACKHDSHIFTPTMNQQCKSLLSCFSISTLV